MTPTPLPATQQRREQQRLARRDAILAAARKVFAETGFDGATVADIAREAGVASGTVYLYYKSKIDLFAALNERLYEIMNEAIRDAPAPPDLRGATQARIHAVFQACGEHDDLLRIVFLNPHPRTEVARRLKRTDDDRQGTLAEILRAGMRAGTVREANPEQLARLVSGLTIIALYQCYVASDGRDAKAYEETVTEMVVGGLQPARDHS